MINILILGEGTADLYMFSKYLKTYLEFYCREQEITYSIDKKRDAYINIKGSKKNKSINIIFKNSPSSNLKSFVDLMEDNESLEKYYDYSEGSFALIYSLFDLDLGSTSENNLKRYFHLEEVTTILSYASIEAEIFLNYFMDIHIRWENIKDKEVLKTKVKEKIKIIDKKFMFDKSDFNISDFIKKMKEDLFTKKLGEVCSEKKSLEKKICCSRKYINEYFDEDLIENYKYYIEEQEKIYEDIKNNTILFPFLSFFLPICEEIKEYVLKFCKK